MSLNHFIVEHRIKTNNYYSGIFLMPLTLMSQKVKFIIFIIVKMEQLIEEEVGLIKILLPKS